MVEDVWISSIKWELNGAKKLPKGISVGRKFLVPGTSAGIIFELFEGREV